MKHDDFNEKNRQIYDCFHQLTGKGKEEYMMLFAEQINQNPNIVSVYQSHADSVESALKIAVVILTFLSFGFLVLFRESWQAIVIGGVFLLVDAVTILALVNIQTSKFTPRFLWELSLVNGSQITFFDDTDIIDGTVVGVKHIGKDIILDINPKGSSRVIYDVPVARVLPSLVTRS